MPPNDVVRHDLTVLSPHDWIHEAVPMPLPIEKGGETPGTPATPPVTTRITSPTIDEAPYQSVGKMGLKFYPSASVGASGWVVAPRAFITAGHCVYFEDRGGWIIQAIFCPRYDLGCVKFYSVEAVFTLQGWIDDNTDRQYDMAACVVTETFGASEPPLAFELFTVPAITFAAIGYPGVRTTTNQFNGKRMWQSRGNNVRLMGSTIWADNNFTSGASGGPWCEPDNNWVVTGLTSARSPDVNPDIAVSPLLEEGFRNLYDAVRNL